MAVPVNSALPTISGTIEVGELLTCDVGTWTGDPTYTFQWQRVNANAVDIDGATGSTYVISANDTDHAIQCVVTATNSSGSASATTAATTIVPADWFIVEDGTGKSDAISYVTTAEADEYWGRRGSTAWGALTNGQKKRALVLATDYMGQVYRLRWKGVRTVSTQALDWPRAFVERDDYRYSGLNGYTTIDGQYYYPSNEVPAEVKRACCELALKAVTTTLLADVGAQVKSETVGPISVTYADGARQNTAYKAVDGTLAMFLLSPSGIRVTRS